MPNWYFDHVNVSGDCNDATENSHAGMCEIGPTGPNVGHTLAHAPATVAAARRGGAFRAAAGKGSVSFVQKPGPASALDGPVSGGLAFSRFTLTF